MLTTVILEGAMGRTFGRKWRLAIKSPREALAMIEANRPGLRTWMRAKLQQYTHYKVVCEYQNGRKEALGEQEFRTLQGQPVVIRFVPLIQGAKGFTKVLLGAALIAISFIPGLQGISSYVFKFGVSLVIGGVVDMLTPRPKTSDQTPRKDKTSYYFDGAVNTTGQGVPVQLIYGRLRVGSHVISAGVSVDQLMG